MVNGSQRDGSIRPNQIFAASLPFSPLTSEQQSAVVEVVRRTRSSDDIQVGAGPRAMQSLLWASRASAGMAGRDFVTPDDVRAVAVQALEHRLLLLPESELEGVQTAEVLDRILHEVPVPR